VGEHQDNSSNNDSHQNLKILIVMNQMA